MYRSRPESASSTPTKQRSSRSLVVDPFEVYVTNHREALARSSFTSYSMLHVLALHSDIGSSSVVVDI